MPLRGVKTNDSHPAGGQYQQQQQQQSYKAIAAQWAKAKAAKDAADAEARRNGLPTQQEKTAQLERQRDRLNERRRSAYESRWRWTVAFWAWILVGHAVGIWLFTSGFLLTRLVLPDKSTCSSPPIEPLAGTGGDVDAGCWHPKKFERAVVVLVDALRYDFTVPREDDPLVAAQAFHNAFPFMYETAVRSPQNAFLLPFIADPPTTTLQRLKGLTTGTLPTFIDAGSNFAGNAIDEDNLLAQLRDAGKKIAHLGDDTWWALFPGYFEPNISKAYDSFNVWDLHTVDNGVIDNIFPLLGAAEEDKEAGWDLLIGHCLGVDHAGHRYGPNHPAMTAKLEQMNDFVARLTESIDDDTLLVVMGDHGMDGKGDHGGESDDEVEAALWMYSKRPVFGRTAPEHAIPPATAKIRPVNQIDLVPTLALLLGIPIPFNNLGKPIEEAFAGPSGDDWANLATVSRIASAGIERYQESYFAARGMSRASEPGSPGALWALANGPGLGPREMYAAFAEFQRETLHVCKGLWARFDVPRMVAGVFVTALGALGLLMYSSRDPDEDFVVSNDAELDYAERRLELLNVQEDETHPDQHYHFKLLEGLWDKRLVLTIVVLAGVAAFRQQPIDRVITLVMTLLTAGVISSLHDAGRTIKNLLPTSLWGWMSVVFTLSQSLGFSSNSFTIWEDSILLFFIVTFGLAAAMSSFRIENKTDRTMAIYHSAVFVVLGRLASYSKLCREEQMPYCTSTYYASVTSSTSAAWQLAIPFVVFFILPSVIKSFLVPTKSYEGLAPTWIGYVFRAALLLAAVYWAIDAADNGEWIADRVTEGALKTVGVYLAQTVLALALVGGTTAFVWAPPSVSILSTTSKQGGAIVTILGYGNALGARYLLLPLNMLAACVLLTKPMGSGALALMMWQVLSLAEIVDLNGLKAETIGPVVLALLGKFYFFKTGHQAVLASIQWDSAFVPLFTVRYPWSPLAVALNTFAGQILAAVSVPLLVLWKVGPKQRGVLETTARALAAFVAYFAVEALATMACAGWQRRHLMLYRIFSPRYMLGVVLLLVLDLVGILVALTGVRSNTLAVSEVFGWAE
ncbi:GPI ethanolamine phosphate transferase 3 [Escovopsis weberi]|uniref:GPI ethanolamine phosphate transferase 3 n=1 Tax=Escovopsis weberi TaxID=150374 RepID=A0A0M8N3F4_ESCWE|nr:GPI ethanolamine phosphate transferase 3 [Escovopsis weberi]